MAATGSKPAAVGRAAAEAASPPAGAVRQAGEQRNARVESLRALGALGIIVAHILVGALAFDGVGADYTGAYKDRLLLNAGYLGFYLFFGLSGYLLYLPFARHVFQGRPINLRSYARNRALRMLPLYFIAITFLMIVYPFNVERSEWWRFALFIQNYSPETINRLDPPLWTVSVEIQFYILLPLLAWVLAKLAGPSLRRTVLLLAGIGVASFALRLHEVVASPEPNVYGFLGKYALPTNLYGFIAGMLVAPIRLAWERHPPAWASRPLFGSSGVWLGAGIALLLLTAYDVDLREPWLALAAFFVVGACVLPLRGVGLLRALEWRPLATLGIATYSLYVWHAPILVGVVQTTDIRDFKSLFVVGVPLCIAAGVLSYYLIERPSLRRRQRWGATAAVPPPAAEIRSDDR